MRIYEGDFEGIARASISRWGNCEEHNFEHFICLATSAKLPVFISFDDDMGILALKSKTGKVWYMVREVLASKDKKVSIFLEFADYILNDLAMERLQIEVDDDFRNELLRNLKDTDIRACDVNYFLDWPLFDMKRWDGDIMPGKEWKKLRNIKNKFYREHKVEIKEPSEVDIGELRRIVNEWKEKRAGDDFANSSHYLNIVDDGFKGFDEVRIMVVDGRPRAMTGGWKISNSDQYYSSVGVYDYSIDRLGEIANLDDLVYLKNKGYKIVNFGGSDKNLLEFKNKFMPHSSYRTYVFSVMGKDNGS